MPSCLFATFPVFYFASFYKCTGLDIFFVSLIVNIRNHAIKSPSVSVPVLHTPPDFCDTLALTRWANVKNLPDNVQEPHTSVSLRPHLRRRLTFWLCMLFRVSVFAAHPDSPEAAGGAGGGAGGVPLGSQTVHGMCLRPNRMSTVSGSCFRSEKWFYYCPGFFLTLRWAQR